MLDRPGRQAAGVHVMTDDVEAPTTGARRCWRSSPSSTPSTRRRWPAAARSTSSGTTPAASCWPASGSSCWSTRASAFLELSPLAGWGSDFTVGARVVTGIGVVEGVECMIIANDPTVKGGASNPWTVKKIFRAAADRRREPAARRSTSSSPAARTCRRRRRSSSPAASSSATSPGRQRRRSCRRSRWCSATPPPAAPTCPGMSDYVVMVKEQAKVFLGGPPLVKMATGEESDDESLGGAEMHARTSGLADYLAERRARRDPDRPADRRPAELAQGARRRLEPSRSTGRTPSRTRDADGAARPDPDRPQGAVRPARGDRPDLRRRLGAEQRQVLRRVQAALRRLAGDRLGAAPRPPDRHPRQRAGRAVLRGGPEGHAVHPARQPDRRTRCCSCTTPPATWSARSTSRAASSSTARMMINAVSNSTVPHLSIIMGASYGAGNYGMNGRAYDPRFLFTWPSAKSAVMGPAQLAGVLSIVARAAAEARGKAYDEEGDAGMREFVEAASRSRACRSSCPGCCTTTGSSTRATPAPSWASACPSSTTDRSRAPTASASSGCEHDGP